MSQIRNTLAYSYHSLVQRILALSGHARRWKLSETMATWLWHSREVLKAFVTETLTCLLLVKDQLRPNVKNLASHSRYRTAYVTNFTFRIRVDVPQKVSKNQRFWYRNLWKCCHYCSPEIMQYQECWVLVRHLARYQRSGSTGGAPEISEAKCCDLCHTHKPIGAHVVCLDVI